MTLNKELLQIDEELLMKYISNPILKKYIHRANQYNIDYYSINDIPMLFSNHIDIIDIHTQARWNARKLYKALKQKTDCKLENSKAKI